VARLPVALARAMRVGDVTRVVAAVAAAQEAERRVEVVLDLPDREAAAQARVARNRNAGAHRAVVAVEPLGVGLLIPRDGFERTAAAQARVAVEKIGADDGIVDVRARVSLGRDDADRRFSDDVRLRPNDGQVLRAPRVELVLAHGQRTDLPTADSAADLAADLEIHDLAARAETDPARKERARVLPLGAADGAVPVLRSDAAKLEDIRFTQKERALLRKEQVEAGQIDLTVVDL